MLKNTPIESSAIKRIGWVLLKSKLICKHHWSQVWRSLQYSPISSFKWFYSEKTKKFITGTADVTLRRRAFFECIPSLITDGQQVLLWREQHSGNFFCRFSWFKRGLNFRFPQQCHCDFLHIIGLVNQTGVIAIQFLQGPICYLTIADSLSEAFEKVRFKVPFEDHTCAVIDNASVDKSKVLNSICQISNISLFFVVLTVQSLIRSNCFGKISSFHRKLSADDRLLLFNRLWKQRRKISVSQFLSHGKPPIQIWSDIQGTQSSNLIYHQTMAV